MKLPLYSKEVVPNQLQSPELAVSGAALQTEQGHPNNPDCACKVSLEHLLSIEEDMCRTHPWLASTRAFEGQSELPSSKEQQLYRPSSG
jgi:hypothetical protein